MKFPRQGGVFLHITSLPGGMGSGDLGPEAFRFVDWLAEAGQRIWQIMPLTGIGKGNSPYTSPSAMAGNELLISLEKLVEDGFLSSVERPDWADESAVVFDRVIPFRMGKLAEASGRFGEAATQGPRAQYEAFCAAHAGWLDDYALFMALSEASGGTWWNEWDAALAGRDLAALDEAREAHAGRIAFWKFCQWQFDAQWRALRRYANERGIKMFGDIPIFVAENSADVWARPHLFKLDAGGKPMVVAGVPPDYFSETGQRWGNPLYDWDAHAAEGFGWWTERVRHALEWVDILRIDHFRGLEAQWEIPTDHETALNGQWVPVPGRALLETLQGTLGPMPLVAEDLGIISDEVIRLRKDFRLPGMAVLQFAWDGSADNPFLPHNHTEDMIAYTGTHDNDTTLGWWQGCTEDTRHLVRSYFHIDGQSIVRDMISSVMHCRADQAIIPMQDVMELDGSARMNEPGNPDGNWGWRFRWTDVRSDQQEFLRDVTAASGRGTA